jgi:hypothetical protein
MWEGTYEQACLEDSFRARQSGSEQHSRPKRTAADAQVSHAGVPKVIPCPVDMSRVPAGAREMLMSA